MKLGIIFSSLFLGATLLLTGCKEDIDLTGNAEETAVVYGLLNQSDSIHYIKINKAFITNDNALTTAQIPDSNYFKHVEATIKEVSNGVVTRTWTLKDTLIENKESGAFFAPEQKVYYFKTTSTQPLIANATTTYKLDININEGQFNVTGETKLITGMTIQTPSFLSSYSFASNNVATYGYSKTMIKFTKGDSYIMDVTMQIAFNEFIGTEYTTKTFDWKIGELADDDLAADNIVMYANGNTFYNLIKENATDNPAITKRMIKYIKLTCTGGSEDLSKYMKLTQPSSSLAQTKPTFTNLSATNGRRVVGIFSARGSLTVTKNDWTTSGTNYLRALDANSMKELSLGAITGSLLFCTDNPAYSVGTPEQFYCN